MRNKHHLLALVSLSGVLLVAAGWRLSHFEDRQSVTYNDAMRLYLELPQSKHKLEDADAAMQKFDEVVQFFRDSQQAPEERSWWRDLLLPQPDRRLAALARFQQGKIALSKRDVPGAVDAWKDSLFLNPGNDRTWLRLQQRFRSDDWLNEEANHTRYNLESLFQKNKSQAQREGKGKGEGKGKQKAKKQAKGQRPGDERQGQKPGNGKKPGSGAKRTI